MSDTPAAMASAWTLLKLHAALHPCLTRGSLPHPVGSACCALMGFRNTCHHQFQRISSRSKQIGKLQECVLSFSVAG